MARRGRLPKRLRRSVRRQAEHLLETGRRFKRFDQVRQRHFWSEQFFRTDANGYIQSGRFPTFITPPGQVGQGWPVELTERETNWKSSNRVPDNQNFELLEIGVSIQAVPSAFADLETPFNSGLPTPREANAFAMNTIVAVQYLTNEVSLGLINDFAQSSGLTMGSYEPLVAQGNGAAITNPTVDQINGDPINSRRFLTNGFAGPGLRRRFKVPILLQHGETFSLNFLIPRTFFIAAADPTATGYVLRMEFWATESFVEKS